jgi:hypothetical protein
MMSSCNYNSLASWIGEGNLLNREILLKGGDIKKKNSASTIAAIKSDKAKKSNSAATSPIAGGLHRLYIEDIEKTFIPCSFYYNKCSLHNKKKCLIMFMWILSFHQFLSNRKKYCSDWLGT